jgi:uncharacterized protein (TIGR00369 family)
MTHRDTFRIRGVDRPQNAAGKVRAVPPTDRRVQVPPNCDLTLGMVCLDKSEPGRTVWRMTADERFANPTGIVQGGFLAAFADSSMGASALTFARERKVFAANAEMKVSFLKPVPAGTTLTCTAYVLSGGTKAVFAEAEVADENGRLVLKASSTYLLWARDD